MLFNSITFLIFHLICLMIFWSTKSLLMRNTLLFTGSLFFYGWYYWPGLIVLGISILFNYYFSLKIAETNSKKILSIAVIANLASLSFFKYSKFILDNFITLFNSVGVELTVPNYNYWLPLGISFYTFQIIGYLVDIYRKEVEVEKDFVIFGVFKCFYAQLIAGPIVRAKEFLPQLRRVNTFNPDQFKLGIYYILAGLSIKIVIADTVSQFVDFGFSNPEKLSFLNSWLTLYGFAVQILSDFWGYSTIAIGIAYMYGLKLPLNFNNPYIATSIRDFWRRWHITLSFWLRDYLYISLGGNRKYRLRNLMITMTLGGLWHGASWNFIFWGVGHGLWLVLERIIPFKLPRNKFYKFLNQIIVFHGVCLLWVFFRADDFRNAFNYFQSLLGSFESSIKISDTLIFQLILFFLFILFFEKSLKDERFLKWSLFKQVSVSLLFFFLINSYASAKLDFIYFVF
mgnify:CR=1 FL=1